MEAILRDNYQRLKRIFLYYDSEPMEVLQGIMWIFLFIPLTIIEHGFSALIHTLALFVGILQIFCVLNCSLKRRKFISFVVFLWSVLITVSYFIDHTTYHSPTLKLVFVFISLFAMFNLKRLTIERINRTKWIK